MPALGQPVSQQSWKLVRIMFCYYSYHFITYFHIYMGLLVSIIVSFISLVLWKYNIVLMTTVFLVSSTIWKNKTCHLFKLFWKCLAFHSSMWCFRTNLKVPQKTNKHKIECWFILDTFEYDYSLVSLAIYEHCITFHWRKFKLYFNRILKISP